MSVDGRQGQRACMTKVTGPHTVRRQGFPVRLPEQATGEAPILASDLAVRTPDLLVIGGGAGGLSAAAVAAEAGLGVVLIDERARPGGQFFKQPGEAHRFAATIAADRQVAEGRARIDRAHRAGVEIVSGAEAWGAFAPLDDRRHDARAVAAVPATPADRRDGRLRARRAGPGMDAARRHDHGRGADAAARPTACCPAGASLVCGNGPLNLQVALELARAGAEVVAVAELAERPGLAQAGTLLRLMSSAFDLAWQGTTMLAELRAARHPVAPWARPDARRPSGGALARLRSASAASRSTRC